MTSSGPSRNLEPVGGDRYSTWDAAYVLGSLSSAERKEYEAHLAGCDGCRAAVGEMSGMPALLTMLDVEDVRALGDEQLTEPPPLRPEVRAQVLDRVRWRRRRSRLLTYAAASVAAALLAVGLVIAVRPGVVGLQPATPAVAAQQLELNKLVTTPFSATISLNSFAWGTRIDMACTYGDWSSGGSPPSNLGMVVVGRDGSRTQIATWLGLSGATALPSGNTPVPVGQIASVQLVSADSGQVLLERQL